MRLHRFVTIAVRVSLSFSLKIACSISFCFLLYLPLPVLEYMRLSLSYIGHSSGAAEGETLFVSQLGRSARARIL